MGKKVWNFINNLDLYLGCTVLVVMVIDLLAQVIVRYVFGTSIKWSEELARYSILWLTFAGMGYGVRKHMHLEMTMFYNVCPPIVKKILQVLVNLLIIACYSYMLPQTFAFTIKHKDILVTAMKVPFFYIYLILPPAVIVFILRVVWDTIEVIRDKNFGLKKAGEI